MYITTSDVARKNAYKEGVISLFVENGWKFPIAPYDIIHVTGYSNYTNTEPKSFRVKTVYNHQLQYILSSSHARV